jgi:hypothetical protein
VRAALADRHHPDLRERRLVVAPHPETARFRSVSGTSHSIPSTDISRHGLRNAPIVSRSATGSATCENTRAIGSGPSRLRAWVDHSVTGRKSDHGDSFVLANVPRNDMLAHRPLPADTELA